MSASNRASVAAMVIILFGVTAERCSDTAGASGSSGSSASAASGGKSSDNTIAANLTDLPTYPHLKSATMMGTPPNQGAIFEGSTDDPYPTVVAWYRSRLTGATEKVSGYIDTTTPHKEIEFHMVKWNEQVMVDHNPQYPGTTITLAQDAHR